VFEKILNGGPKLNDVLVTFVIFWLLQKFLAWNSG